MSPSWYGRGGGTGVVPGLGPRVMDVVWAYGGMTSRMDALFQYTVKAIYAHKILALFSEGLFLVVYFLVLDIPSYGI